jgi:four helix bundle protein
LEAKNKERWRLEAKKGKAFGVRGWRFEAKNMAGYLFPFEKLEVWQLAVELADFVLGLLEALPQNQHLRLISQMEAAVTSPAQNTAEGRGRQHKREFIQFLYIAQGSLYEVVTLNEVFRRRKLFSEVDAREVRNRCEQIDRKINGLVNSLRGTYGRKYQSADQ